MKKALFITITGIFLSGYLYAQKPIRLLIFSKTSGYRHESIETGRTAIARFCINNNIEVDSTEDAGAFTPENLNKYNVLIFLNTTGDLFNDDQKKALQGYIHSGGGWIGIHAATDAEFNWPWYGKLAGAYFTDHPAQQEAVVKIVDRNNPATSMLPDEWKRFDEWYNFKDVASDLTVLGYLDESSYKGGGMHGKHPFIWYHEFEGGKAFYTGFGHPKETYKDTLFLAHILGAVKLVTGSVK